MQGVSAEDNKTYRGWSSYETWVVGLWIDNDEGLYLTLTEIGQGFKDSEPEKEYKYKFANYIKEFLEELMPELGANMWADLLNSAWSEVDFYEIAEHLLQE